MHRTFTLTNRQQASIPVTQLRENEGRIEALPAVRMLQAHWISVLYVARHGALAVAELT
jgi:hypothetical protein